MRPCLSPERNRTLNGVVIALATALFAGGAPLLAAEENCCPRSFAVPPARMPQGPPSDWGGQIASAISSAFTARGGELRHCPLPLEEYDFEGGQALSALIDKLSAATGAPPTGLSAERMALYKMDYLIVSSLSVANRDFTATVRLLDHHHGQTVKSGSYSWSGDPTGFGSSFEAWVNANFNPLDDLIYDYERKPQSCRIAIEGDTPGEVQAGATVTVHLEEIFDHNARPSQTWQRVYVKAEKGKILNGREQGEYRVFEVGKGDLAVTYRAPEACRPDKDTITVYNTCYTKNNPDGTPMDVVPDKEISKKQFDIVCDRWLVTVTYTERWTVSKLPFGEASLTGSRSFSQTLRAEVNRKRQGEPASSRGRLYEAAAAQVDLEDQFQQITQTEEGCKVVAGWHGAKHGAVGGAVRLELNDSRQLHLESELTDDAPAWKTAFQWSSCPPWPDGACEETDTLAQGVVNIGSELFTDSGPLVVEESQDFIRGERHWSELGTGAPFQPEGSVHASANCSEGGVQAHFTSILWYGLFNADRVPASKTITWEFRRPAAPR